MSGKEQKTAVFISASSERLVNFLEETGLHKKDFAEMIGVTLSYVYSLIDSNVAFSTRVITLERIAVVMNMEPEEIPEYKVSEEPKLIDRGTQFFKEKQHKLGMSNLDFIKKFPRNKRVEIVDLWRGALPLPLDWNYLYFIAEVLDISANEIYPYWQARMQQYFIAGGLDVMSNSQLVDAMFQGAKSSLKI